MLNKIKVLLLIFSPLFSACDKHYQQFENGVYISESIFDTDKFNVRVNDVDILVCEFSLKNRSFNLKLYKASEQCDSVCLNEKIENKFRELKYTQIKLIDNGYYSELGLYFYQVKLNNEIQYVFTGMKNAYHISISGKGNYRKGIESIKFILNNIRFTPVSSS